MRNIFDRHPASITGILVGNLLLVVVVFGILGLLVLSNQASRTASNTLNVKIEQDLDSLASALAIPIWNIDSETIEAIARQYENDYVQSIVLLTERGEVLFESERTGESSVVSDSRDIYYRGERIGQIHLALTDSEFNQIQNSLSWAYVAILLLLLIALFLTAVLLLNYFLRRPLAAYAKAIDAFVPGDQGKFEELPPYRELDPIRSVLGTMSETIARQLNELLVTKYAVDNNVMLMFWSDQRGEVKYTNLAMRDVLGYSESELQRLHFAELFAKWTPDRMEAYFQRVKASGGFSCEETLLRSDGQTFPAEITSSYFEYEGEGLILSLARDITETRKTERDLLIKDNAVENSINAIVIAEIDGGIAYVNGSFLSLWGFRGKEDVIGGSIAELWSDQSGFHGSVKTSLECGNWVGEIEAVAIDGREFVAQVSLSVLNDGLGNPQYLLASVLDTTEVRAIENRLRQAQKMEAIGTVAGGIAHDFNNVLAVIVAFAEVAVHVRQDESQLTECLAGILESGRSAQGLVKQILSFGRKTDSQRIPMRPAPIIKEALQTLSGSIAATIDIDDRIDPRCSLIMADRTHLHQILMNLCTNAAHAMGSNGTLGVELRDVSLNGSDAQAIGVTAGSFVLLRVSDTGEGISPEVQERIFEPFFTTKSSDGGTGLGLSIVHGIMSEYGGGIKVNSRAGEGATFELYFPTTETHGSLPLAGDTSISTGSERVLVIDDDERMAESLKRQLSYLGYRAETFSVPDLALEAIQTDEHGFDLIITDQRMPGLTGLELSERIAAVLPDLPIILCSGYRLPIDRNQLESVGVRAFVTKPLTLESIADVVRQTLDKSRSTINLSEIS